MDRLWSIVLSTALFLMVLGATGDKCPEDNREYRIPPGQTLYGYISSPSGKPCDGKASLVALSQPPQPSLLFLNNGWQYLFGAVVDKSAPATVIAFLLSAQCDGVEVCQANVKYVIDPTADATGPTDGSTHTDVTTTTTRTTTTEVPEHLSHFPPCAASREEYRVTIRPGKTKLFTLPTSAVHVVCKSGFHLSITQPLMGSAALLSSSSTQIVYASPNEDVDTNITLPYEMLCSSNTICKGSMLIWLHETAPQCPKSELFFVVQTGKQTSATLDSGVQCSGVLEGRIRRQSDVDAFEFHNGQSFTFTAPNTERDSVVDVRFYCDDEPACDARIGFIVTNKTPTTHKPIPTEEPTTPPQPNTEMCPQNFNFTVPTGNQLRGTLHVDISECNLVTYNQTQKAVGSVMGSFQVNIVGDFLYVAPSKETIETLQVDVSCIASFRCRTEIMITSYHDFVSSSTTTTTTQSPVRACANVYYYQAAPGVALSSSLNGLPGQDPCVHGRYFSMIDPPTDGKLDLMPIGDFLYRPPHEAGPYRFHFNMYCLNKLLCHGTAYILVSNEWTLSPNTEVTGSSTKPPENIVKNPQIKCRGTCNEKAWKTYPKPPLWDNMPGTGYARSDGHPVDGLDVSWSNNSLIITVYTIIGNLGVRFPTFEPLHRMVGKYFEPQDFVGVVEPSSLGFELSCLSNQGTVGMGEDVWRWRTLGNGTGTGTVGALYNKGTSWYQKFGGKHIECDTFVDSCRFAPLLTPRNGSITHWKINIDNCDATWTGTFPYSTIDTLKKSDGSPVWYFVGNRQIKGTIISEVVRANSWIEPARSFDQHYDTHDIIFNLQQFIVVRKLSSPAISIDAEFFEYQSPNGDRAFGVNLLVHPHVTEDMETSYAEDRHIAGFKWVSQHWVAPSTEQCPTCQGTRMSCTASGKFATSTYTGEFPTGDCPPGTGRIELRKGPAMAPDICPPNQMHVFNQSGISAPVDCATSHQNITIRGVVVGSGTLSDGLRRAFGYEGRVVIQLLMTDGSKHDLAMDLFMYVARLSQDSYAAEGGLGVCRGSDYWPVLDPLGASLPDSPFELSSAPPAPLCIDALSSTFGPSGWATVFLQLPGVKPAQVEVHSVALSYNGTVVYLMYQDSITGKRAIPPKSIGYWWQRTHPFLSFRDLRARVINKTITTGPSVDPEVVANVPFAFTFIPGSINLDTNVEVVVKATITTGVVSTSTFRRMLHVDPMMTQRSRYGPPKHSNDEVTLESKGHVLAIGVIAGIAIAVTLTGVVYTTMDNNRPLPGWVPRGKLIKNTVLAAVPAGLRPAKKEKQVLHKDMYDAMKSGRY